MNEINNNNKIFREQAEERFSQYQKEIENLRNSLNKERNKEKLIVKKNDENSFNKNINIDKESKEKENEEGAAICLMDLIYHLGENR